MHIKTISSRLTWEKFITRNSPQSLFQSWDWGEVARKIQKNPTDNSFSRLGLFDNGHMVGIADVHKITAKRGTFFHIRHGPIFSDLKNRYLKFLIKYLRRTNFQHRCSFVRISPLIDDSVENNKFYNNLGFIDSPIHRMDGEICWILDLNKDELQLLSDMRKTTRYLIRQAQKQDIIIEKSKDTKDIGSFLSLYDKTAKRHHFVPHKGIKEEFEQFVKSDSILLFKGYHQRRLLSAAMIIFYNDQAIYHHSASIEQKIPVNYLLQWEVIKEAKKRGVRMYNFWGVSPPEQARHPWKNLSLFKKGFGGRTVEYLHSKDLPFSTLYCATYSIEWLRKVVKGY